jgi:small subunit ribosomal protein S6
LNTEYEILLMLDPELPEERQEEILVRTRELVERGGGTWDRHEPWGRRKLAYEIAHKDEGVYHLVEFTAEPATLDEASRILKITDGVMRHMAVRRIQRGPGRPLSRPPRDGQDAPEPVTASEEE